MSGKKNNAKSGAAKEVAKLRQQLAQLRASRRPRRAAAPLNPYETVSLNPFSTASSGAKIPDQDSAFSNTMTVETTFTLTPYSYGRNSVRIAPASLSQLYTIAGSYSGEDIATFGPIQSCADYTELESDFSAYRVVAAGIEARYVGNSYNNGGQLVVHGIAPAENSLNMDSLSIAPITAFSISRERDNHRYDSNVRIVAKRMSIESTHYNKMDWSFNDDDAWAWYQLFLVGCDGSSPQSCQVTITQHLELLPKTGKYAAMSSTDAAMSNPGLLSRVANAIRSMPLSTDGAIRGARLAGQAYAAYRSHQSRLTM
nr:hypothetical protein [Mute swan feces associated noda-like virus 5]